MAIAIKEKAQVILIEAEGRLINSNLFVRDVFKSENGGEGEPKYNVEMAFTPSEVDDFENTMADLMDKEFGKDEHGVSAGDNFLAGKVGYISPLLKGDVLAVEREKKGKTGDAYKGKVVLRAKTSFNRDGEVGPGGARVYGPDTSPIGIVEGNQAEVYNGCYGQIAVTLKTYVDYPRRGDKGITAYLSAFQKRREGEPLKSASVSPFAPVGAAPVAARRTRAG